MSNPNSAKLMEDLHQVVRDIEEILSGAASSVSGASRDTHQHASDALHKIKTQLGDIGEQAKQRAREASENTGQYIKNNPWQSLGLAAGLGLLIGLLLRRRD